MLVPTIRSNLKGRIPWLNIGRGCIEVENGGFVCHNKSGTLQIPLANFVVAFLEPGVSISHAAVALAANCNTLLVWVGEGNVRLYSSGLVSAKYGGTKTCWQSLIATSPEARLKIVRKMFEMRFKEKPPERRSVDQLRGMEGARVRALYKLFADQTGVVWNGRDYGGQTPDWNTMDDTNKALSTMTHCLYAVCEAVIYAHGLHPGIGFLHSNFNRAMVCDIADLYKMDYLKGVFHICKTSYGDIPKQVRHHLRDKFVQDNLVERIFSDIDSLLQSSGIAEPKFEDWLPDSGYPTS